MPKETSNPALALLREVLVAHPGISRAAVCEQLVREAHVSRRYVLVELQRFIRSGNVRPDRCGNVDTLTWVSNESTHQNPTAACVGPVRVFRAAGTWTARGSPSRDPLTAALFGLSKVKDAASNLEVHQEESGGTQ